MLGNHDYLGAYIGLDDVAGREWLSAKLLCLSPVSRAVQDTRLPSIVAIQLTKTCVITTPGYLARCLPLRVTRDPLRTFDDSILTALTARLRLPNPLPITALQSLTQPMDQGGLGIRSLNLIAPAASGPPPRPSHQTCRPSLMRPPLSCHLSRTAPSPTASCLLPGSPPPTYPLLLRPGHEPKQS